MNWKKRCAWRFNQAQAVSTSTAHGRPALLTVAVALIVSGALTLSLIVKAQDQKGRSATREPDSTYQQDQSQSDRRGQAQYERVLQIKAQTGALPFSVASSESDIEPRGPSSLSLSDEGNFLIANKADNSVVELSKDDGSVLSKTRFINAEGLADAVFLSGLMYALDHNDGHPRILMAGAMDNAKSKVQTANADSASVTHIDPEAAPRRLAVINEQLAVETVTGERLSAIDGASSIRPVKMVPVIAPGNPFAPDAKRLRISIRGKQAVNLSMPNAIAQADLLGVVGSGEFFVYVVEVGGNQLLLLDHKVLWFSASGKLLGQARVPAYERAFAVPNGTTVGREGNVYSLIPRASGDTDIVRLVFGTSLPTFDPLDTTPQPQQGESVKSSTDISAQAQIAASSLPRLTRSQIVNNARNLASSTVWTSATNIGTTSSCRSRVIPAFLRGKPAGWYQVAYSWGGADTPADYNAKLSRGFLAGNAQNAYTQSCSVAGVDCSGFIANVWQMYGHPFSTGTLPGSGTVRTIPWSSLMSGDVLNWAGTHIMMYDRPDGNSVWVWGPRPTMARAASDTIADHGRTFPPLDMRRGDTAV